MQFIHAEQGRRLLDLPQGVAQTTAGQQQPGLGIGWAASKTPNPTKVRALNLLAHTVFGLGLWLTALLIR